MEANHHLYNLISLKKGILNSKELALWGMCVCVCTYALEHTLVYTD